MEQFFNCACFCKIENNHSFAEDKYVIDIKFM